MRCLSGELSIEWERSRHMKLYRIGIGNFHEIDRHKNA